MNVTEDEAYFSFTRSILKFLHLDHTVFYEKVSKKEPYETQIHLWIREEYALNRNSNEAIKNIYAALRKKLQKVDCC